MSKTPEQLAGEYAHANTSYGHSYSIARQAFLAGYQAAKDTYKDAISAYEDVAKQMLEEAVRIMSPKNQLADADKVIADDDRFVSREMPMYGLGAVKWNRTDTVGDLLNKSAAKHALRALDEKTQPQWISVKERLPEMYEWVLIDGPEVCKRIEPPSSNWKEQYVWETNHDSFYSPNDVTHWMPLPEPPKGGK